MMEADFDLREVDRGFAELVRRGAEPRALFAELKPDLRADQIDHKKKQQGPEGRWAALDPDTRARRPRARRLLGRLSSAVAYKAGRDALTATSRVKWSRAHQDGARVGNGARLPARPFLWFSSRFLDLARDSAEHFLERVWGRQ